MSIASDPTPCSASKGNGLLPVDPYQSLRVHFGMLLGVEDFATWSAYHRGKMWLHNAWLHGAGTIWGLAVSEDSTHGEIRVAPGLAIDALGREMRLEADACVSVARWYEQHREDPDLNAELLEEGGVRFDAHVVMQFKACLSRQVPAMSEPCDGAGTSTAYSRVVETVELLLVPGLAPRLPSPMPYHRLRLLFRLEDPVEENEAVVDSDQEVLDRRSQILSAPAESQPALYLEALREFAARDQLEIRPATTAEGDQRSLFPALDPAPLVLADLTGLTLSAAEGGTLTAGLVDNTVRRTILPTTTIQELLGGASSGAGPDDAGGPRIDPSSVTIAGTMIRFPIVGESPISVTIPSAITVSLFDATAGWSELVIESAVFDATEQVITVQLQDAPPTGLLIRLIVRGSGPMPLLGENRVPLAGALGGSPGGQHQGIDFVHMFETT